MLLTGICAPHHFLPQGVEVFLAVALDDFHFVGSLADGENGLLAAFLRPAVNGYEEIMASALHADADD